MYLCRLWSVYEWKFDQKPRSMTSRDKTTQVFEMTSKMWSEEGLMNWLRIWSLEKNLECLLFVRSPTLAGRPHPQRFVPMDKIFFCEETNRSHLVWSTDDRILGSVLGLGFFILWLSSFSCTLRFSSQERFAYSYTIFWSSNWFILQSESGKSNW